MNTKEQVYDALLKAASALYVARLVLEDVDKRAVPYFEEIRGRALQASESVARAMDVLRNPH